MILVNVLFVCALAAAVVMLMINAQSVSVDRTIRLDEAARALSWARAGEASAVAALRRDRRDFPQVDHPAEAWSAVMDTQVPIEGGAFSLAVEDDQARFNLNALKGGGPGAEARFRRIAEAARIPPADIAAIVLAMARGPELGALVDLAERGAPAETLERLAPYVTALPGRTTINLNSADPALLAIAMDNPLRAQRIVALRRQGPVDQAVLRREEIVLPPGVGVTSDHYSVITTVEVGQTRQALTSRLRRDGRGETAQVIVWRRERAGGTVG